MADKNEPTAKVKPNEAAISFEMDDEMKKKVLECIERTGKLTVRAVDLNQGDVADLIGASSNIVIED